MKGFIILADGFEDVEAIATIDILRRSKLDVELVTINDNLEVTSSHQLVVKAEKHLSKVCVEEYDFLIIPGGRAVFSVWDQYKPLDTVIGQFVSSNKLVCAICAGPALIGKLGYFADHQFTCFPGSEKNITKGTYLKHKNVVCDHQFITAKQWLILLILLLLSFYTYKAVNKAKKYKKAFKENCR
ncbi:MAG: DJ-1/PfpI family protein, partial [Bacilli bacterium]|nr:DJ-1/PfpI family protein [Bacilli bacterium]